MTLTHNEPVVVELSLYYVTAQVPVIQVLSTIQRHRVGGGGGADADGTRTGIIIMYNS